MKEVYCRYCFQLVEEHQTVFDWWKQDSILCGGCKQKLEYLNLHTKIASLPLHILYLYNDAMEAMIYQFKECRDITLKDVFFHDHMKKINDKYRHYQIVILPSSYEKVQERGFHHMEEMLCECHLPILSPFMKSKNRKQSLQTYEERLNISRYIHLKPHIKLNKKPILIIDDVCTTGSTLKCAYQLLAPHTVKIEALVLCAHPLFVEQCDER